MKAPRGSDSLPLTLQTAYAELLEQLTTFDAHRSIGHKLIIAKRRAAAFHTKREKDLTQAAQLIESLAVIRSSLTRCV